MLDHSRKGHFKLRRLLTRVSLPSLDRHPVHTKVAQCAMHLFCIKLVVMVCSKSRIVELVRYPFEGLFELILTGEAEDR